MPIQIQTDWYAQPEHGGFYQAWMQGYYAEEGLAAEVIPGQPSDANRQKVASGRVTFGVARIDDLITGVANGLPLVGFCGYMQRTPLALMLHESNPIDAFEQLDGAQVMCSPGAIFISFIESHYDIKLDKVPHTWDTARFMADPNFIQQVYLTSEPYYLARAGAKPKILGLADGGFGSFRVIYTRREFLEANPEVIHAVVRASIRGWEDYMNGDPTPAHEAIAQRNPQLSPEFMEWTHQQMHANGIIFGRADNGDPMPFWQIDRERVADMMDLLVQFEIIDAPLPMETFLTWEYLPDDT